MSCSNRRRYHTSFWRELHGAQLKYNKIAFVRTLKCPTRVPDVVTFHPGFEVTMQPAFRRFHEVHAPCLLPDTARFERARRAAPVKQSNGIVVPSCGAGDRLVSVIFRCCESHPWADVLVSRTDTEAWASTVRGRLYRSAWCNTSGNYVVIRRRPVVNCRQ